MYTVETDLSSALIHAAADVIAVEGVQVGATRPFRTAAAHPAPARRPAWLRQTRPDVFAARATARLTGRLLVPSDEAYSRLAERLRPFGLTPVLRKGEKDGEVLLMTLPGTFTPARPNVRLAGILFIATALSCLYAGAQMVPDLATPGGNWRIWQGWPFAVSLLIILAGHEFSHYLTARRLNVPVSLPYFIPMPLLPFGTLGAVINMPAPPRNRRQLLAVGAAGPLASFILSLPILWLGLRLSPIVPIQHGGFQEGNSLIYALLKFLEFGRILPGGGYDVQIGQVAFAGWAGLLVTALNLIPAGQLDGGHILYALFGERWADRVLWGVLIALAALSFLWLGWLLWVGLAFLASRLPQTPLDAVTTITQRQRLLGVVMLVVFVLVFIPVPLAVIP